MRICAYISYPIWHHVSIGRSVMIVEYQNSQHDAARHHEHDAIEVWSWIEVFPKIPRRKNTKRRRLVTEMAWTRRCWPAFFFFFLSRMKDYSLEFSFSSAHRFRLREASSYTFISFFCSTDIFNNLSFAYTTARAFSGCARRGSNTHIRTFGEYIMYSKNVFELEALI